MKSLHDIYNKEYVNKIVSKSWRFEQIPIAMKIVYDYFKPESVIDFGYANGLHLKALKDLGCEKVFGIEGTQHFAPYLSKAIGDDSFQIANMAKPINFKEKFIYDLAMSIEVLEHIDEKKAEISLTNITSCANTILFTASPSKGGFKHSNPQPKKYWKAKFLKLGFKVDIEATTFLIKQFADNKCQGWFISNLLIFKKENYETNKSNTNFDIASNI